MFGAGSAVGVSSYQNFSVAAESVEKQSPQLRPTHAIGRDGTHMASPYVLHPGQRVGQSQDSFSMPVEPIQLKQDNSSLVQWTTCNVQWFQCKCRKHSIVIVLIQGSTERSEQQREERESKMSWEIVDRYWDGAEREGEA